MYRFLILAVFALMFTISSAHAQETTATTTDTIPVVELISVESDDENSDASSSIEKDETVTAKDLGVAEPILLPDSNFYFLKNWGQGVRSFFTVNPIKKAELHLRYANEKLLEVRKLTEKKSDSKTIEKAMERYERQKEKIEKRIEKIKDNPKRAEQVDKFLDKLTDREFKNQRLLDKLHEDLPDDIKEKFGERRERALRHFTKTVLDADSPEKFEKRLARTAELQRGGKFKHFKNLEILQRVEENTPEEARKAIQIAQENALNRLRGDLSRMSPEDKDRFSNYIEHISGDQKLQAIILDKIAEDADGEDKRRFEKIRERKIHNVSEREREALKKRIENAREHRKDTLKHIREFRKDEFESLRELRKDRIENVRETRKDRLEDTRERRIDNLNDDSSSISPEAERLREATKDRLENVREIRKDRLGDVRETRKDRLEGLKERDHNVACIQIYKPVCGANGKTYSNECVAVKQNGVRVAHDGKCRSGVLQKRELDKATPKLQEAL